jgi:hypothetical protein
MRVLLSLVWLVFPALLAAGDLRTNAFFKALEGGWTGDGEFLSPDHPPSSAHNEIACSFTGDGTEFLIKGHLLLNDQPVDYVWTYSAHEIEGIYRARWKNLAQPDAVQEYSVNIDEANLVATLEPVVGVPGASVIRMVKTIKDRRYEVEVRMTDPAGNTTLQGLVRFTKL